MESWSECSFIVESQDEGTYRLNRFHIRPTKINVRNQEVSRLREPENNDVPTNSNKDQTIATPTESNNSGISPSENVKDDILPNSDITARTAPRVRPKRNTREPANLKDFVYYK
ncbi:hypothetical protein CHS0354_038738 [Potamilus streckersoni]|uniref:Uncharacterized protein n=1 Tax=Potamilus streckersoni TaxID=2493646 RepID=A0AAE0VZE4_9BIVA|nr:hypothetical protein CHS0354_038738 [Potamilus streckersoni]